MLTRLVCPPAAVAAILLLAACGAVRAAGQFDSRSMALFLVDLARHHGLTRSENPAPADALHVRTLLRAALRFDERCVPALELLYELAARGQDAAESVRLLERLIAADPENHAAFLRWLETACPDTRTLEGRQAWLRGLLQSENAPLRQALIHVELAHVARQQLRFAQAAAELAAALRLDPLCPPARLLAAQIVPDDQTPAEQLRALLPALELQPMQVELAWSVARLLDQSGFHDAAWRLYQHVLALREGAGGVRSLDAEALLTLSANAAARRDYTAALDYARRATRAEGLPFESVVYLIWLHERHGAPGLAQRYRERLEESAAALTDPEAWGPDVVAQAAWLYCLAVPRPELALRFAESAAARAPDKMLVRRALGWALAEAGFLEEAKVELEPIAPQDAYAAARYAQILRDEGDEDAPARVLAQMARRPVAGFAREALEELVPDVPDTPGAPWRVAEVGELLAAFHWDCLDLVRNAARFVLAEAAPLQASVRFGEPWAVQFTLTNTSELPILLGPDAIVNPVLLISARCEGERVREFPGLLTVHLDRTRWLRPGQTARLTLNLEIGPLRRLSRMTPQHLQRVTIAALLDPVQADDGTWHAGPAGFALRPAFFHRLPAAVTEAAWSAYDEALGGASPAAQARALATIAALLGEQQRAARGSLGYRTRAVPTERLYARLRAALESDDWELRAAALDALQACGLDTELLRRAEACLHHEHWLVRMLALRLLARQGAAFQQTAQRVAEQDPDALVRDLARSLLAQPTADRSAPAAPQSAPAP